MTDTIELLSPARNLECGIAAVDHGADAVYIGAAHFGARAAAGNSAADIARLCDYAHRFGVKVYVTVNTLLRDDEREEVRHLIQDIYHAGADALIIQDTALLQMDLPPIPLHASTQMDNRTAEKVEWLNKQGLRQIVLARELTLEEIKSIHLAVPEARLEAFVHGALCVSYSGRCYASEHCFGRSANRGECAQFCRLPFSLQDADGNTLVKDRYLLSLRDMNRSAYLEQMMDAGVRSFKIEGRLKDIAYVKNVTAAYRQAIDAVLKHRPEYTRVSFGTSTYTFRPDLSRSFSRGSTDYFLFGRTADMASPLTPKSRGREVGHVKELRRDCIVVSSSETFSNGDGLCFFSADGQLQGFRVNRADGNHLYPATDARQALPSAVERLRKGDRLWRSFDKQWEDIMSGKTADRRVEARFVLEETTDGFRLTLSTEDGKSQSKTFTMPHQPARTNQSLSIKETLGRLGDTHYVCKDIEVRFSQPWFIPRSNLAEWRREVCALQQERHVAPEPAYSGKSPNDTPFITPHTAPLMTCRFCIRHAWGQCKKEQHSQRSTANGQWSTFNERKPTTNSQCSMVNVQRSMVNGQWSMANGQWKDPLYLVLGDGRRFRLEFDCKNCEMKVHG